MRSTSSWPEPPPLPPGRTVVVPGRGELFVRDSGGPGSAVVLLHGWTASGELNWFLQWQRLADAGHRVVLVDHRGHGRGLRSPDRFTLEDCADDVVGLIDVLGARSAVLAGYSMGGPIATLAAHRHPDRVDGIVLVATAMEWRSRLTDRAVWRVQLPALSLALRTGLARRGFRRWLERNVGEGPDVNVPWVLAEVARGTIGDVVAAGRALSKYDAREIVPRLDVPGQVIITTRDRLVPPWRQRELAAALGTDGIDLDADHDASFTHGADLAELIAASVARIGAGEDRATA